MAIPDPSLHASTSGNPHTHCVCNGGVWSQNHASKGLPHRKHQGEGRGRALFAAISTRCARQRLAQDGVIENGIQERCAQIQNHANDEDFIHSLEYYTTCRVKHAFLRMNTQSIEDRLNEVQNLIGQLRVWLLHPAIATESFVTSFKPPPLQGQEEEEEVGGSMGGVDDPSDPNTLCLPQDDDYMLDALSVGTFHVPSRCGDNE